MIKIHSETRTLIRLERDGQFYYIDPFTGREHEWGTGKLIRQHDLYKSTDGIRSLTVKRTDLPPLQKPAALATGIGLGGGLGG